MYTRALDRLFRVRSLVGSIRKAFSPADLFTPGVNGVWYDPSDFTTLFQDAAGTTPVTAVEQPVGLMLDKSKGLVLGPELVTNGDFSSGTTGWTAGAAGSDVTLSVVNQRLRLTKTSTASFGDAVQQITGLTATKHYRISVNGYVGTAQVRFLVGTNPASGDIYSGIQSATDIAPVFYVTGRTSFWITVLAYGGNGTYAEFDNISVRELPGNHAFNPSGNSANFPVLQQDGTGRYYLAFNGANQWLQTNSIDFTYGDKMFVCAGVRWLSDASVGVVTELSSRYDVNQGAFLVFTSYTGLRAGNSYLDAGVSFAQNTNFVRSSLFDGASTTAATKNIYRLNAVVQTPSYTGSTAGTSNFGNYPIYWGARAGAFSFGNMRLYGAVVAGKQVSASEITNTETYLNQKTGAF